MNSAGIERGRHFFLALAAIIVASIGLFGVAVGASAQTRFDAVPIFDLVVVRPTPLALGALGAGLATAVLVVLYGLVALASRYDEAALHD